MKRQREQCEFMNMCMIYDNDHVVVQDRVKPDWPGIIFPGGHVEEGESFTDAVIREVKEETGLVIEEPELCGIKDWCKDNIRYMVLLYKTNKYSGTLQSSREGEVRWERLENLPKLNLSPDMEENMRVFREKSLSELFYRFDGERWLKELK